MTNPKINIASLDFDDIKTSLKTYLSGLDEFDGYDFNASGINMLLDILAYNTMYYSFYSNMIANETFLDTAKIENNIVSLVKPLGVLVSGKSASKIEITAKSVSTTDVLTAHVDYFVGTNQSGSSYRFYPIKDYSLTSGSNTDIVLYEGNLVALDLPVTIEDQSGFVGNTSIDINTLVIRVNGDIWTKYNTFQSDPGPDSEVYFVDRTSSGFYVIFGKKTLNDFQASFGKELTENDVVTVSYLIPSGVAANGISSVTNNKVTISASSVSGSGTDGADLDLVKFYAPKMFAANDRAVTKDDYYGLLFSSQLLPAEITKPEQVNVWGGEEADPPSYGRVFVSYANVDLTTATSSVKKSIAFLKSKAVVTVLPEYVQPQIVDVAMNLVVDGAHNNDLVGIEGLLEEYYNTPKRFNNSVYLADIKNLTKESYPNIRRVDISESYLSVKVTGSGSEKSIYFKNEIETSTAVANRVWSSSFSYKGSTIVLGDVGEHLVAKNSLNGSIISNLGNLGTVNYNTGIVSINSEVLPTNNSINIFIIPKYRDSIIMKNELLVNFISTVIAG